MVEISEIVRKVVGELHSGSNPETADINNKDNVLRVAVGSDHGGFEAKEMLKQYLKTLGYRITDVGTDSKDSVDYPDFAVKVAKKVASGDCERGIMIDGAGIGSSTLHAPDELCEMARVWLETRFAGGRHWSRINKMMAVERII